MKKSSNKLTKWFLLLAATCIMPVMFASCDEDLSVEVPGHWIISDVSMNPLMTLDFYDDNTVEVNNATYNETPEFEGHCTWDYNFYYDGRDTILHLSSSSNNSYFDDDGNYSYTDTDVQEFVYHRTSISTITLISEESLVHHTRTYKFIRR